MIDHAAALHRSYEHLRGEELLNAPVRALAGVTEDEAEALEVCLGIRTVRDLAMNRHVLLAQRLLLAAGAPRDAPAPGCVDDPGRAEIIDRLRRSQEWLSQAQASLTRLLSEGASR